MGLEDLKLEEGDKVGLEAFGMVLDAKLIKSDPNFKRYIFEAKNYGRGGGNINYYFPFHSTTSYTLDGKKILKSAFIIREAVKIKKGYLTKFRSKIKNFFCSED